MKTCPAWDCRSSVGEDEYRKIKTREGEREQEMRRK